jgi:hypothetical protein
MIADRDLVAVAAQSTLGGDPVTRRLAVDALVTRSPRSIARHVADLLEAELARAWERGWQPADVRRFVGRECGAAAAAVIALVIAAQARTYDALGRRVAPAWMAQVDDANLSIDDPSTPYLLDASESWPQTVELAVTALAFVMRLPRLPLLVDPPSKWRSGTTAARTSLPDGVLAKVRGLLAKAESTTFDAEAEAFTAKAQELMTRHRIDRAMCSHEAGRDERPTGRRIGVDDPYADAKALLLAAIADANDCRCVWSKDVGFSTVFGFEHDLDAVDELFTSLLVQATAALQREGPRHDGDGRSRTTRFRRSFLVAFGHRIGERLREAVAHAVADAERDVGGSFLPVLVRRANETEDLTRETFPDVGRFAPRASDAEGWYAGRAFGDVADVGARRAIGRTA